MSARQASIVVMATALVAGCASQRSAQEVNQLRADVGLLDQRVNQLERASVRQGTSVNLPEPSSMTSQATSSEPSTASSATWTRPSKRQIQHALKNAGVYQGPIDGKLGHSSRAAIREFQQKNGLKVDGSVGRQTWEKLAPYADMAASSPEKTPTTSESVVK